MLVGEEPLLHAAREKIMSNTMRKNEMRRRDKDIIKGSFGNSRGKGNWT